MSIMRSAFPFSVAVSLALCAAGVGAAGPEPGLNVIVNNTPANPVPVTGSVTGSVTGTVGLTPGTSVLIDNTVGDPVRVRSVNDAIQPVQATASCLVTALGCLPTVYTVPAGKRLVIEYASMRVCVLPGQSATLSVATTVGGQSVFHYLNGTPPAAAPGTLSIGCNSPLASSEIATGQQVRIYADAGTGVVLTGTRNSTVGTASFTFSISGYLVDVPFAP